MLVGGGLRNALTIGAADELGMKIESRLISVPDLHATVHCALGSDPSKQLFAGERPVPIANRGWPVAELFA